MISVENTTVIDLIGSYVLPVFLPVLVGLVTTKVTAGGLKAVLLAALSIVTTVLTAALSAWSAGEAFDLIATVPASLATFTIAVATHYGLWKPTGVSETVAEIGVTEGAHRA